jgi:NAD(P)H-dependent FMN reductase
MRRKRISILVVLGSTRSESTNVAALRAAWDEAGEDVETVLFDGLAGLPPDSRPFRMGRGGLEPPTYGL